MHVQVIPVSWNLGINAPFFFLLLVLKVALSAELACYSNLLFLRGNQSE